jgi:hypothetical protein
MPSTWTTTDLPALRFSRPGFQCWTDADGNLWCAPGIVVGLADGSVWVVGPQAAEADGDVEPSPPPRGDMRPFGPPAGYLLLGGNGRNLSVSATVEHDDLPVGIYRPTLAGEWDAPQGFPDATIDFLANTSLVLSDGTGNLLSIGTDIGSTPAGTFAATTYARDTYNSGNAFNITIAAETGGTIRPAIVSASAGTMQAGQYSADSPDAYTSDDDADWTIDIAPDGSAEISDGTDVVATRAAGLATQWDPRGRYLTTAYGRLAYNSDTDFDVTVTTLLGEPAEGVVYITVTEASAGVVGSVSGPFLAASLPASADPDYHVPIAEVTTSGPRQIVTGPIQWGVQGASGGGDPADYATIRAISIAGL